MRPLSPVESIQPAWDHARRLLLTPRRWGTFLKIAAVAFFAQMGGFNSSSFNRSHNTGHVPHAIAALTFAFALFFLFLAITLGLIFFYLGSRLQFVIFEIVLRRDTHVAPIWRRYGAATWRWMGLKILYFLLAVACLLPFLIPMGIHFFHEMSAQGFGSTPDPHHVGAFFFSFIKFFAALVVLIMIVSQGYILLRDFGLPSMALEGTPLDVTVRRVWGLVRTEPLPVLGYLVMYFLMSLAGAFVGYLLIAIVALIALIPFGAIGATLWAVLRHASGAAHIGMYVGIGVVALVYAAFVIVAVIMVLGFFFVFMQAYSLYFLGGRYPLVGQYLEPLLAPPTPAYYAPPTVYPPPPAAHPFEAAPAYPPAAPAAEVYPPPLPAEPVTEPEPPLTNPPGSIDTTE